MQDVITTEKLEKYTDITKQAIAKVKLVPGSWEEKAQDMLDMAQRYYSDANYFRQKGDLVTAFAALNYAHGWLDAGARLGFFDVEKDNLIFTIRKEES